MGRPKWCFGRAGFVCLTRDCPYVIACCERISGRKLMSRHRARLGAERGGATPDTIRMTRASQEDAGPGAAEKPSG
jgi:hypothetical protein